MNVVFLDIDGVLNSSASLSDGVHIVPDKVIMLRRLCTQVKAKIVISSSWRIAHSLQEIRTVLRAAGLYGIEVIGVTPISGDGFRGKEIESWLANNDYVSQYVIIDDDSDFMEYQKPRFVQTNDATGLTYREIDIATDLFVKPDERG